MFARPVDETRWPDQNRGSLSLDSTIRRYRTAVEQLMRAFFDRMDAGAYDTQLIAVFGLVLLALATVVNLKRER